MQAIALLALAGAAVALPQGSAVTSAVAPSGTAPAGCSPNYSGTFEIAVVNVTKSAKRSIEKRKALTVTLADGVLTDDQGRTGYIAKNNQFQFDGPPQAGAVYTAGWSVCANSTLALGDSAIFYQCLSGTFYNLYDDSEGPQCSPVYIDVEGSGATVSSAADGQATAAAASQLTDGQIQATTAAATVSQITDGQIQATTSVAPVSQISDGQIQATTATAAPVSQISDGQIQATTGVAVVTQIADGQIQATTGAVVTQISDGQIQATAGPAPVTQISDGQIQAPTNGSSVATASPTVQAFTGAAATMRAELFGLAAGVLALAAAL